MGTPTFADYVRLLFTLFERFMQQPDTQSRRGQPFVDVHKALIVFVIVIQRRHHGWFYVYGLHLTSNRAGFPKLVQVETAAVSESQVIEAQADRILRDLTPDTLTADNSYPQATRIRQWAQQGVVLLTPALKW